MTEFKELGLKSDIMTSLNELEFIEPSAVQEKCIPFILKSKKDLIALAQTGTGKTGAFGIPILNQINVKGGLQAIILCPTRELCIQISQDMQKFAKHSKGIDITPVYGGERIDIQIKALRRGTHIVVGTPGRVHDLIRRNVLKLQTIEWLVLDEADEMLDMGFKDDLDAILEQTPKNRQTLLFSATISKSVFAIAKNYMSKAEEISIGENNIGADNVTHEYYVVGARDRFEALKRILDNLPGVYGLLFCRTRIETQNVAEKLKRAGYDTEALHGDISQNIRSKIMDGFKKKKSGLLVATDVAARGIDINNLSHVINYNLPDQMNSYTHRSGRTGRAKQSGIAISIVSPREVGRIKALERLLNKKIEYKKVPTVDEIYMKQINNYLDEIESTDISTEVDEKYFSEIIKKLNKVHKDDLIKLFISHKFSDLIADHKSGRDINADVRDNTLRGEGGNMTRLMIGLGRRDGFNIKELFSLINSNKNLKGVEIGRISLLHDHTIFSVDREYADKMLKYLAGVSFKGKSIDIRATTRKDTSGRGRSGGGRARSKNRKQMSGRNRGRGRSGRGRW
ncbi:MAG: DEAD/DEAH box helicase [Candidatus Komeilibacteria bacterium]